VAGQQQGNGNRGKRRAEGRGKDVRHGDQMLGSCLIMITIVRGRQVRDLRRHGGGVGSNETQPPQLTTYRRALQCVCHQ
jgi:hypothetical protein